MEQDMVMAARWYPQAFGTAFTLRRKYLADDSAPILVTGISLWVVGRQLRQKYVGANSNVK